MRPRPALWRPRQLPPLTKLLSFARADLGREHENVGREPRRVDCGTISKRITELGDWRGETLSRMRKLIKEADPEIIEEWKWMGIRFGLTTASSALGKSYKKVVKLTFAEARL